MPSVHEEVKEGSAGTALSWEPRLGLSPLLADHLVVLSGMESPRHPAGGEPPSSRQTPCHGPSTAEPHRPNPHLCFSKPRHLVLGTSPGEFFRSN